MIWQVITKNKLKDRQEIIDNLLKNRGIKTKSEEKEFFNPRHPEVFSLKEIGLSPKEVKAAIERIKKAIKTQEKVFVYGDYDADGVCATAIMWETLFSLGLNVLPYIPERFGEGYGLNIETIKKLKEENKDLNLIITVDHGIVAKEKVIFAKKLGIDIIVTDHHQPEKEKPKPLALIHTTKVSGSAVAYFLCLELKKKIKVKHKLDRNSLELTAIGTIADQLPLVGINRSIVKHGLLELNKSKRVGLTKLFENSGVGSRKIGTYEVGYMIAPRINAMGRLGHAIDSLRLICTKDGTKASELSNLLNKTNIDRQKIVEEVIVHARTKVSDDKVIVLAHESYHEGVIGLAAGRIVEEFSRPAIVISTKGSIAKASARSIGNFNIIEAIRSLGSLIIEGGGHPMAAGFSIKIDSIGEFTKAINKIAEKELKEEDMLKTLKIDSEIDLRVINDRLLEEILEFEPFGYGNSRPTFLSKKVKFSEIKTVGQGSNHLKVKVEKDGISFGGIAFGMGNLSKELSLESSLDLVYEIIEDSWNGGIVQLRIKDLHLV